MNDPIDLPGGKAPPSGQFKWEPVACKCGIKHERGDGHYEADFIKMTADDSPIQLPPKRIWRCKYCKEVLLSERKDPDE
jgi:hypothetical protein